MYADKKNPCRMCTLDLDIIKRAVILSMQSLPAEKFCNWVLNDLCHTSPANHGAFLIVLAV